MPNAKRAGCRWSLIQPEKGALHGFARQIAGLRTAGEKGPSPKICFPWLNWPKEHTRLIKNWPSSEIFCKNIFAENNIFIVKNRETLQLILCRSPFV